ncbi:MAG: hypothetical protein QM482_04485 [Sulfurospirillum sp.]
MIASNKKEDSVEYEILGEVAKEIYKDPYRINVLVQTTKEYVKKIINIKSLNIDSLIKDIDREIRKNPRYITKINIRHLKKFLVQKNHTNEETYLLQLRIVEYFKNELRYYNSKKEKNKKLNTFRRLQRI